MVCISMREVSSQYLHKLYSLLTSNSEHTGKGRTYLCQNPVNNLDKKRSWIEGWFTDDRNNPKPTAVIPVRIIDKGITRIIQRLGKKPIIKA